MLSSCMDDHYYYVRTKRFLHSCEQDRFFTLILIYKDGAIAHE